jgi:hypothetical protein
MTSLDKAIEKVILLKKLAGNNPNEQEILAALAAADRIMRDYQITQAQIEAADISKAETFVHLQLAIQGNRAAWIERIVREVCAHYGAAWYMSEGYHQVPPELQDQVKKSVVKLTKYMVVGKASDATIVEYTVAYLIKYARRLGTEQSKGRGVAYGKSWLEGFSIGVREKFEMLKAEELKNITIQSSAMVILNNRSTAAKAWMDKNMKLRSAGSLAGSIVNAEGLQAGHIAGKNANVNRGLSK